jgi:hypothetical protein
MRGEEKKKQARISRPALARKRDHDASPLCPHRRLGKKPKLNQRDATTSVTAPFIPKLGGKLRQLCTIFEIIIASAITAPTIRIMSCDDLVTDLLLTRIEPSRRSCKTAMRSSQYL